MIHLTEGNNLTSPITYSILSGAEKSWPGAESAEAETESMENRLLTNNKGQSQVILLFVLHLQMTPIHYNIFDSSKKFWSCSFLQTYKYRKEDQYLYDLSAVRAESKVFSVWAQGN